MRGCDLNTYELIVIGKLVEEEIESLESTIKQALEVLEEESTIKSTIEDSLPIIVARKDNLEQILFKIGYKVGEE